MNGLAFEIVSEREISEHFKKRMVIRGDADIANITCSQAFLRRRGFGEVDRPDSQELIFELVHAGRREQHGRIIFGNQHIGRTTHAAFRLEE